MKKFEFIIKIEGLNTPSVPTVGAEGIIEDAESINDAAQEVITQMRCRSGEFKKCTLTLNEVSDETN